MKMRGFAALAVLALAAGCGGSGGSGTTTSSSSAKAFVVLVTDVNQLNDHGFNQLAYQGLKQAQRELGIRGQVYQSPSSQAYIPNLSQAARKKADLVISVGFDQAAAIAKVAKQFPDTHFAIIDVSNADLAGRPKNVQGLIFKEQEVGYLAGYLAGLVEKQSGKQNTIGSVGGQKQPPVDRYIAGYQAGALKADPNIKLLNSYSNGGSIRRSASSSRSTRSPTVQTSSSRLRAAAGSACSTQRRSRASGGSASTPTSRISARRC
jgi:basic membrane protein A